MRPLKIALLSRWYWEENRRAGGPEGGPAQQLAEAVAALGHEVVVLSQSPGVKTLEKSRVGKLETWLSPRETRRDFVTTLRDKWAKFSVGHRKVHSDAIDLGEFLAQRGPFDVLWAQCEEPDGLVAAIAAGQGVTLPPTLTEIYALRYRFEGGRPVFTEQAALRLAFAQATRLVAHSRLVADALAAYASPQLDASGLRAKTTVLHHNLHREFLRLAEEGTPTAPEPGRVLFLGALNEKKGALDFLKALPLTVAAKAGGIFVVVGDYTEKDEAFARRWTGRARETQDALGLGQLELRGRLALPEVMREIGRAAVVVLPSLYDEFSRATVEALLLGRPVVVTKGMGVWPLVNEHVCGLVTEPGDPAALAQAIDEVLKPGTHYAANAQHVAHRLLHEFSPEAIALQMAHQLEEIAKA